MEGSGNKSLCKQMQRCRALAPPPRGGRTLNALAQCLSRTSIASFQPIRVRVSRKEVLHLEEKNEGSEKTDINTNQKLELLREWAGITLHLDQ